MKFMIRSIIIDDEPSAISVLQNLLQKKCKDLVEVIGTSNSALQGKELIEQLSPDLVFLDIEMPGMNGIELLRSFNDPPFKVIFVTAYDSYAIEAFHLSAVDYILKPVEANELLSAIEKIRNDKEPNTFSARLHHLEELLSTEPRIGIALEDKIVFVNIANIVYCEANGSYTNIFLTVGKKMVASKPLCDFELQLMNHNFFRIHHSFLINIDQVKEFQRQNGGYVIMENGKQLEVSHRKRKDFLEAIHEIVI
jgi:two-component system, LytTR family, response regulator